LLTVGRTVDEAAFLFYSLDQACHSQLLAEAAAANGIPKSIIADHVAQFNADVIQSAVRVDGEYLVEEMC
jgi:ribulose-5-phosphate 4-epimerase/fuculose-1-phosphate aldolase